MRTTVRKRLSNWLVFIRRNFNNVATRRKPARTAKETTTNSRVIMTSKKISKAKRQIGDQTTKGGVIGIMIYALSTNNVDPVLIGLLVPVASSVLAWVSTKIGDPDLACLFIPNDDDKQKN
jgi:hypothetical protein